MESVNRVEGKVNLLICVECGGRKIGNGSEVDLLVSELVKIWKQDFGPFSKTPIEIEPRQKRYNLREKAEFIEYMAHHQEGEAKSNVTWYAERHGVSRTTLYNLYGKFQKEFEEEKPGSKGEVAERLAQRLEEKLRRQEKEFETLKAVLGQQAQQLVGNEEKIIRAILQATVGPMSAKGIREFLETTFGLRISKRKIKQLIAEYSRKARQLLQDLGIEGLVEFLAADEVFCGKKPVLTGVDLTSFAVVICEKQDSRDHEAWHKVLRLFPCLKLVTSDQAKGIVKAVYLCGDKVRHQFDLFHFKRNARRALRRLEAQAYKYIAAEYEAEEKMKKSQGDSRLKWQEIYHIKRQEALKVIKSFDRAEAAVKLIYQSLEIFERDGSLHDPQKGIKNLRRGAKLLQQASDDKKIQNLAQQALDPRLSLYLLTLQDQMLSIVLRWNKDCITMPRNKVIQILASFWYWSKRHNVRVPLQKDQPRQQWAMRKQQALTELYRMQVATLLKMRQLQMSLANFDQVLSQVTHALDNVFRASSLVEALNSHIRLCQQVKKNFGDDFLALVSLHWNMSPFEEGKRKGLSPFQILGIQGKNENWLDFLLSN